MTDNVAVLQGFTLEVVAESDIGTLFLLVKPGTDYDDVFRAWDTDEQKFVNLNGWLWSVEEESHTPMGDALGAKS